MKSVLSHEDILEILKKAEILKDKLDKLPRKTRTFISDPLPEDHPLRNYKPCFPDEQTLVGLRGKN